MLVVVLVKMLTVINTSNLNAKTLDRRPENPGEADGNPREGKHQPWVPGIYTCRGVKGLGFRVFWFRFRVGGTLFT